MALRYDWRGGSLVTVHNFDEKPHDVRFRPSREGGEHLVCLTTAQDSEAGRDGTHRVALEAYGYRWFRVRAGGSPKRRGR